MKPRHLITFALLTGAACLCRAQESPATVQPFHAQLATAYLRGLALGQAPTLEDYLTARGLNDPATRTALEQAITRGRAAWLGGHDPAAADFAQVLLGTAAPTPTTAGATGRAGGTTSSATAQTGAGPKPVTTPNPNKKDGDETPTATITNTGNRWTLHTGARQSNPYRFTEKDDDQKRLAEPNDETRAFLEFIYLNSLVDNPARRAALRTRRNGPNGPASVAAQQADSSTSQSQPASTHTPGSDTLGKLFDGPLQDVVSLDSWDLEARVGITTSPDDAPTTSAAVGSGEFSLETRLTKILHTGLFEGSNKNDDFGAYSFGFDLAFGVETDTEQFDAHWRKMFGLSYSAAFRTSLTDEAGNPRFGWLRIHGGRGRIDTFDFKPGAKPEIIHENGIVLFENRTVWEMGADLIFPFGKVTDLTISARAYSGHDPNPWSVQIGFSRSLDKLFSGLPGTETKDPKVPAAGK